MPYDLPIENSVAVHQAVCHTDEARLVLENYTAGEAEEINVELPDYDNLDKALLKCSRLTRSPAPPAVI